MIKVHQGYWLDTQEKYHRENGLNFVQPFFFVYFEANHWFVQFYIYISNVIL